MPARKRPTWMLRQHAHWLWRRLRRGPGPRDCAAPGSSRWIAAEAAAAKVAARRCCRIGQWRSAPRWPQPSRCWRPPTCVAMKRALKLSQRPRLIKALPEASPGRMQTARRFRVRRYCPRSRSLAGRENGQFRTAIPAPCIMARRLRPSSRRLGNSATARLTELSMEDVNAHPEYPGVARRMAPPVR